MAYRLCLLGALVVLGTACFFSVAAAQQATPTAAIVGRLVDVESHAPISRARIAILGARHDFPPDSEGRFVESHLASGTYVVQVRALGYAVGSWLVQLGDGEILTRLFELEHLPYVLEPVVVQGRRRLLDERLQQFERRRAAGGGYFITAAQIEAAHPRALVDLLRTVPGVQMICAGASHCTVRMLRTPRQCRARLRSSSSAATTSVGRSSSGPARVRAIPDAGQGRQRGKSSMTLPLVICHACDPSALVTQMCRPRSKAMYAPSGDQEGNSACNEPEVTCTTFVPSAFMT